MKCSLLYIFDFRKINRNLEISNRIISNFCPFLKRKNNFDWEMENVLLENIIYLFSLICLAS